MIRTLATDKGFKERVREDMLVRLLDAFVWRSHGMFTLNLTKILNSYPRKERQDADQLGFTYVQGMNVLAAPFLYTMPSEVEAFFCFAKFIEESCPLYVQPTLEGVHRGLKVSSTFCFKEYLISILLSFLTGVFNLLTQNYLPICDPRTFLLKYMRSLVCLVLCNARSAD